MKTDDAVLRAAHAIEAQLVGYRVKIHFGGAGSRTIVIHSDRKLDPDRFTRTENSIQTEWPPWKRSDTMRVHMWNS